MDSGRPSLANVLTALIRKQRLNYAHIARIGGISRNTVRLIANGDTVHPSPDTLCRIAVGLAADPYSGRTDQDTIITSLDALGQAAGLDDLRRVWIREALPVLLTTLVGDRDRAADWVALIAAFPELDPEKLYPAAREVSQQRPC